MATAFPELFNGLSAEFHPDNVKSRSQAGRSFQYITARTVMNRLDAELGPENWWDEYVLASENSVVCRLTIRLPDGTTLTKVDAGGMAGMADQGDDDKSGFSDAFKRAAVKFGVGRYLYRDGQVKHERAEAPPVPSKPGLFSKEHTKRTAEFAAWLKEQCDKINRMWHEGDGKEHGWEGWKAKLTNAMEEGMGVPEKVPDVITFWQARGHLFKWATEQGFLQFDEGVDIKEAKTRQADAYVALVFHEHKKELLAEMGAYIKIQREKAENAIYREHEDLAPVGWVDPEGSPANGDAYEGDLALANVE